MYVRENCAGMEHIQKSFLPGKVKNNEIFVLYYPICCSYPFTDGNPSQFLFLQQII